VRKDFSITSSAVTNSNYRIVSYSKLCRRLYRQIGQLFALEEVVNVGLWAQVKVVIAMP
jgi:hypothetical protein